MVKLFKKVKKFNDETDPLLGTKKGNKSSWWCFICFTLIIIVVVASVIIYLNSEQKSLPVTRVLSIATTNGDYFKKCAPHVTCHSDAKYRTYNGSCNNLQNPNWGAALTPYYRLIDAEFSDGKNAFRLQLDGKPLPSARLVGVKLFYMRNALNYDRKNNELLVPWGQFLTHDISYYPDDIRNATTPANLDHCDEKDVSKIPFECAAAIRIPKDDPVYSQYNITVFKFVRSMTSVNFSCPLIPTTILNRNTQYIDASHMYGSDEKVANDLRTFKNGKLRSQKIKNEEYCPQNPNSGFQDGPLGKSYVQFAAGDVNLNQNLAIALFQNLFLRFHNYLAENLQTLNPFWSDEKVYQETRKMMGAVIQVITYDHFLPILLGNDNMKKYGLVGDTVYDPSINSAMAQEMTSGAFRVVHNIIPAKFNLMASNYTIFDEVEPSRIFNKPDTLLGNVDSMLRGFLETPGRAVQPSYNTLITNLVFKIPNLDGYSGFDLMSYDIQRGRDNGIPPYNQIRKLCGMKKANTFADLSDLISLKDIETLKTLYSTVHDIDFLVGALLEKPENDSMVGPSTSCVIGDSFYRFKNGDRFFYDVQGQPGSFTPEQIKTLKNITLSHVMCSSSHLDHLQKETFRYVDHKWLSKFKYSCDLYKLDLSPWKEE